MPPDTGRHPPPQEPPQGVEDRSEPIRRAIARELPALREAVAAIGCRIGIRTRDEIDDMLGELTAQLLQQAAKFNPQAPLLPWAMGFFKRILAGRGRRQHRARRVVPLTDVGPNLDGSFFDSLRPAAATEDESPQARVQDRIDVQTWLAELNEADRRIVEARYFEGLKGEALAEAVGAANRGSAAVRLHRAMKRLVAIVHRSEAEGGAP